MINEDMFALGDAPNRIREIYAYGLERKALLGDDKVFDLSIGNPSVPSPAEIDEAIDIFARAYIPAKHGYTSSVGLEWVRERIADNLNRRFGTAYVADDLYLTPGASGALASAIKGVACPGEEVLVNVPFYPEYRTLVEVPGARLVQVPAADDFQLNIPAIRAAITPKTAAIIVNSPNNPVGTVYTRENLQALADALREKSAEIGHPIYLISDEPYRELVYGETETTWIPDVYDATLVCYSWSKSFSLPGERIGYVLVPTAMPSHDRVYKAVCGAGRGLGYICDSVLFQHVIGDCIDAPINVEPYAKNREILMAGLRDAGYSFIEPKGAFYVWLQALEPDSKAFCDRAKQVELLLVPSDGFGVQGWARASYCCSEECMRGAVEAFKKLKALYDGEE